MTYNAEDNSISFKSWYKLTCKQNMATGATDILYLKFKECLKFIASDSLQNDDSRQKHWIYLCNRLIKISDADFTTAK